MNQFKIKLCLWCLGLMTILQGVAQPTIARMEYFIDTDPGYGNGITINNNGTNNLATSFSIDLTPIASGVHVVGVRSKDANGSWSLDNKYIFRKAATNVTAIPNITKVEYFIDADPSYGKAISVPITAAQDLSGLGFSIDLTNLNQGVHTVGTRSQDANGAWSLDNKYIFLKLFSNTTIIPNINKVEYFIDADPGYGKAISVPITAAQDLSGLGFSIDLTNLNQGVHIVGVRSQDANGAWSLDNKWILLKPYSATALAPRNVSALEYYFDTDPGYGKATPVTVTSATQIDNLMVNADITGLSAGNHNIYFRSQDDQKAWSLNYVQSFTSSGVLPVTMLYFKAVKNGNTGKLTWATSSEINNKNFLVQRSIDGINFITISTINAAGNSNSVNNYNYDDNISALINYTHIYYRLQQIDINGESKYSTIAVINMAESNNQLTLFQNPVKFEALLNYTSNSTDKIAIKVIDANGKTVILKELNVIQGNNTIQLNTNNFVKGIYLIETFSNLGNQFVRMLKQ